MKISREDLVKLIKAKVPLGQLKKAMQERDYVEVVKIAVTHDVVEILKNAIDNSEEQRWFVYVLDKGTVIQYGGKGFSSKDAANDALSEAKKKGYKKGGVFDGYRQDISEHDLIDLIPEPGTLPGEVYKGGEPSDLILQLFRIAAGDDPRLKGLKKYWKKHYKGRPKGSFTKAVKKFKKHKLKSPEGLAAYWEHKSTGYWPAEKGGKKKSKSSKDKK